MGNEGIVKVSFVGRDRGLDKSFSDAWKKADTFEKKMNLVGDKLGSAGKSMTVGFTVPVVAGLTLATKAAMEEDKQMAVMAKTIKNVTGATDDQIAAIETWISKQEDLTAFGDGELRPALQNLVVATKDVTKAQDLMGVTMDIAAAKGLPVEKVAAAISKAYNGNVGALGKLGIKTKDAEGKTLSFERIMKNATKAFGGQAQDAAQTTAGKFDHLKNRIGNLTEDVGRVMIPIFEKVVGKLDSLAKALQDMDPGTRSFIVGLVAAAAALGPVLLVFGKLITAIGAIAGIVSAAAPIVGALAAAFQVGGIAAFGSALAALLGPVGMIVLAVGALIAIVVTLYKTNEDFRNFVKDAWEFIKNAISTVAVWVVDKLKDFAQWVKQVWDRNRDLRDQIASHWPAIKAAVSGAVTFVVAKLGEFVAWVRRVWNENQTLRSALSTAWNLIKGAIELAVRVILRVILGVIDGFEKTWKAGVKIKDKLVDAWGALKRATKTVWDAIAGVVSDATDKIVGFVNKVIRAINWVIEKVPGIPQNLRVPEFGDSSRRGGGGGFSDTADAPSSGTSSVPSSAGRSTPKLGDNGGTGAEGDESSSGGVWGRMTDWVGDMMRRLGIPWPGQAGGLFGGASNFVLDIAKSAAAELIRKYGAPGMRAVEMAKTRLGDPYVWGGQAPGGFDCSGLLWWAYDAAGFHNVLPRTGMWTTGRRVAPGAARPGDVMFYYPNVWQHGKFARYGHVKMYAGNGQTIESASGGVQMRAADWGGAGEVRTYLAKGGVIIGGESGEEAVLPLTDRRAMEKIRRSGAIGGTVEYHDNRRINIVWRTQNGSVSGADVQRLYAQINAVEARAASARRRGSVR